MTVVKLCPQCKTEYDEQGWRALPLVNRLPEYPVQVGEDPAPMVQIRSCACGLALTVVEKES